MSPMMWHHNGDCLKEWQICLQYLGLWSFTIILYIRNRFLHWTKIEDRHFFLCEKFHVLYPCSAAFHSGKRQNSHTHQLISLLFNMDLCKNLLICRLHILYNKMNCWFTSTMYVWHDIYHYKSKYILYMSKLELYIVFIYICLYKLQFVSKD
jgi:hypothetical protein